MIGDDFEVIKRGKSGVTVLGLDLCSETRDGALVEIATRLERADIVTTGFAKRLLEREHTYPTGLQLAALAIALPHVEAAYCHKNCIVVARNASDLYFNRMDAPETVVPVRLMIVLCMSDPAQHLEMLGSVSEMLSAGQITDQLLQHDLEHVCAMMQERIGEEAN